jgi:catechol 2,3-dioxygenase-like lactoylglutathione lyase family enzyme
VIVERTDFVSVPVTDLEGSTAFYRDTLGQQTGEGHWPEFRLGENSFLYLLDPGVCHMAHFADPDGNVFMLHRRYAPGDDSEAH